MRKRLFSLDSALSLCRDTGAPCIPLDMLSDVITEAHDSPHGGGHEGAEIKAAAVMSWFYWPHSSEPVLAWIRGWEVCHRVKHSNQVVYGLR